MLPKIPYQSQLYEESQTAHSQAVVQEEGVYVPGHVCRNRHVVDILLNHDLVGCQVSDLSEDRWYVVFVFIELCLVWVSASKLGKDLLLT